MAAGSTIGTLFKVTTWGESHGKAIGVVADGCPAGLAYVRQIYRLSWTGENRARADLPPSGPRATRWRSYPAYLKERPRERPFP